MKKLSKKGLWTVIGGVSLAAALAGGTYYYVSQQGRSAGDTISSSAISQSNQGGSQVSGQYQVETREISYESNGNRIYGVARIPKKAGRVPTVLFAHGFGGNHEQESTLQQRLAKSGIAVYAIDFAGGTGYSPGQSEGEMTDMSVLTEQKDLEGALKTMHKQSFVDTSNIFLLGASQGGVVSSLTAVANSSHIRGLALLYPAFSLIDDAHKRFDNEDAIPDTYNLMGLTVGRRYFADVWNMTIFNEISKYKGPVSIFHGTADDLVPMSYEERASRTFPHATLTRIEGGGHGFSTAIQKKIAPRIIRFVKDNRH
ncbi:alpha/beta hydrolase family protein [Streptococcus troglodytae]|uniref:Feruloyl esterase n=1 Tax=Streptococcus troglodytae TaxID=1111760 RepID=A0A1L7LK08_9STRE|nr:alpha/beta fold hydrolase [Streptococcus troglodytae]BAQ24450.1 feruloyl esterase [Streptococcus troglodytae]